MWGQPARRSGGSALGLKWLEFRILRVQKPHKIMTDAKPYLDGSTLWLPYDLAELSDLLQRVEQVPPPPQYRYRLEPGQDIADILRDIPDPDLDAPAEQLETVWVDGGTHTHPIYLTKRVNVRAIPGTAPIISGWRTGLAWEVFDSRFQDRTIYRLPWDRAALGLHHHVVTNAAFRSAPDGVARMAAHNLATEPEYVSYEGEPLRRVRYADFGSGTFEQAYDDKGSWLYISLPFGVAAGDVEVAMLPQLFTASEGVDRIEVEGLTFEGAANTHKQAAFELHGDGNRIRGVRVEDVNSLGFSIRGIGLLMQDVDAFDCGQMGHWLKIQRSVVEWCGHSGSNWRESDAGWHASNKWEQSTDNTVTGWWARECSGAGLWLDVGNHRNTFTGLDLTLCAKNALLVEHYAEGNTFSGEIHDTQRLGRWAGADIQIQSNVKNNVFEDLEIAGDAVPYWLVYKTTEARGSSGPNTFRNIAASKRPALVQGGRHEKDIFENVA